MSGGPDREHLSHAVENDRVSVAFDDHSFSLVEGSEFEPARISYVQQVGRDIGDVLKAVDAHLESRSRDDRRIHYC